jgi:hypothetical protein
VGRGARAVKAHPLYIQLIMWCAISSYFNNDEHGTKVTVNQNRHQQRITVPLLHDLCCARNMLLQKQQSQQDDKTLCTAQQVLQVLQVHFTQLRFSRATDYPFQANTPKLTPTITYLQVITKARVLNCVLYDN